MHFGWILFVVLVIWITLNNLFDTTGVCEMSQEDLYHPTSVEWLKKCTTATFGKSTKETTILPSREFVDLSLMEQAIYRHPMMHKYANISCFDDEMIIRAIDNLASKNP